MQGRDEPAAGTGIPPQGDDRHVIGQHPREPRVLILDEPANGLDPEGIAWIRGLLRDFADRGGTVLLSSHLFAETQATADCLVIVDRGRVVASGTQRDLLAGAGRTLEELFLSLTDPAEKVQ
jgi:ABC-type multidrug transport system ATPase subunit